MKVAGTLSHEVGVWGRPVRHWAWPWRPYYRRRNPPSGHKHSRPTPARALSEVKLRRVLDVLCSERFVVRASAEVVATLADEECFLCSERTMYRILAVAASERERRNQRRYPTYEKKELVALAPNQIWSWDIERHEALLDVRR